VTTLEYIALSVTSLLFVVGVISSILPVIPGGIIVWTGVITHKLWIGDESISWKIVIITGILILIGQAADIFMGIWGARRFGATWKGAVGAFTGAIVGFFLPPPLLWLILGPVIGAVIGELAAGRTFKEGGKAGIGTVVGSIIAFALKLGISISVVGLFYTALFL